MPTPLTWDAPGLSWDTPGLTWDGNAPESNPPNIMPDNNRISATLSPTDKASILTKIDEIRALLPFLVSLTAEDREELPKLGDKTLAFDEKCASYMVGNPVLVPGFVSVAEVAKDRALRVPVLDVWRELGTLFQEVSDTATQLGSEIYVADLSFYASVRQAARQGVAGAETIYGDLKARFPGGGGPDETPVPPVPPTP